MAEKEGTERRARPLQLKVYIVALRKSLVRDDAPNIEILDVKLTRKAAEEVRDRIPGTFIVKRLATK